MKAYDRIGSRYIFLTVLSRADNYISPKGAVSSRWLCRCDCGNETTVHATSLGKVASCGCTHAAKTRKASAQTGINRVLAAYKYGAKDRGHSFELADDVAGLLLSQPCHYCNALPSNVSKTSKSCSAEWRDSTAFKYNGIDRRDNTKGYTVDNCVPCCYACNRAKMHQTIDEFNAWLARIRGSTGIA